MSHPARLDPPPGRFPRTHLNWTRDEAGANGRYYDHFYRRKAIPFIIPGIARRLSSMTDRVYAAEILHTNLEQSFRNRDF